MLLCAMQSKATSSQLGVFFFRLGRQVAQESFCSLAHTYVASEGEIRYTLQLSYTLNPHSLTLPPALYCFDRLIKVGVMAMGE